ncbi:bile acid:sodium symporter family protein [Blastopirellula marina]|uniref:bile acid:sodium symporter family protein n=1 Tax=Blastopirellula marina TaxID=124 RepID=UPI001304951B|nr:bile acid:sodium symporter [Blastopirellula marina]
MLKELSAIDQTPVTSTAPPPLARLARMLDAWLLVLLLGVYALAAFLPTMGILIRKQVVFGNPLPVVLLSAMLLSAGIGIEAREVRHAIGSWWQVLIGCVLLVAAPWLVVSILGLGSSFFPPGILAGLALVALMPSAASSVAWTQLSRGNVAVNVALILLSTLATPLLLGLFWDGGESNFGEAGLPIISVGVWIIPSILLGVLIRYLAGEARIAAIRPMLKVGSATILLLLNYINASVALPEFVGNFQPGILFVLTLTVLVTCGSVFAVTYLATSWLKTPAPQARALWFGIGMKNTGMALVLAAIWLEDSPLALVTIISYTFTQHLLSAAIHQRTLPADAMPKQD